MKSSEVDTTPTTIPAESRVSKSGWITAAQVGWVVLAVLALAALAGSIPGYLAMFLDANLSNSDLNSLTDLGLINMLFSLSATLTSMALAALLFWRKRDDRMALFLAYFFVLFGIVMSGPLEAVAYLLGNDQFSLVPQTFLQIPVIILLFIFPTGSFVPLWSRWLVLTAILLTPPLSVATYDLSQAADNPWTYVAGGVLFLLLGFGFYSQILRYKRISTNRERMQVKWVIYGLGVWFLIVAVSSGPYMYRLSLPPDVPVPGWMAPVSILWWIGLMALPISFTVAILRYRLWDIDFIIRRTVVYALLTALLLAIYFGTIVALQALFTAVSGQQSPVAIVISTLIIAALFQPLRQRIQAWIDRRFFRAKYDANQALARFSRTARDEVDLEQLTAALLQVTRDTLHPESVFLWLPSQLDESN